MKGPTRYHLLANRKPVESDAVSSYWETFRLYNLDLPAILLLDGTQVAEAIVHFLHPAGLDLLVFPLTLVLMTFKTNVK